MDKTNIKFRKEVSEEYIRSIAKAAIYKKRWDCHLRKYEEGLHTENQEERTVASWSFCAAQENRAAFRAYVSAASDLLDCNFARMRDDAWILSKAFDYCELEEIFANPSMLKEGEKEDEK